MMQDKATLCLIYTTWPDQQSALDAAKILLQEKLIACANLLPVMQSVYMWKGQLCQDNEYAMILKTANFKVDALEKRFMSLHPYEVPAFMVLPVEHAHEAFSVWMVEQL